MGKQLDDAHLWNLLDGRMDKGLHRVLPTRVTLVLNARQVDRDKLGASALFAIFMNHGHLFTYRFYCWNT